MAAHFFICVKCTVCVCTYTDTCTYLYLLWQYVIPTATTTLIIPRVRAWPQTLEVLPLTVPARLSVFQLFTFSILDPHAHKGRSICPCSLGVWRLKYFRHNSRNNPAAISSRSAHTQSQQSIWGLDEAMLSCQPISFYIDGASSMHVK